MCLTVLKEAAREGVFRPETTSMVNYITDLSSNDANNFSIEPGSDLNILKKCFSGSQDMENGLHIIDTLIDRAAKLVAANLAAVVLKTEKGRNSGKPVLITIEGTTFFKMHNLRNLFEGYFGEFLSGDRKRYVEFTEVEKSSLIGAALAALIN